MTNSVDSIKESFSDIQDDLQAVNTLLHGVLHSDVELINTIAFYIINSGGKRFRPQLSLLASEAIGYQDNDRITMAAVIELIHTATLLHDDVVDDSELRRGDKTANTIWGNSSAVLVGDYLYSKSFQLMVQMDSLAVMGLMSETTNRIAEGEVLQLMHSQSLDLSAELYQEMIYCKTGCLFEAAVKTPAILAQADTATTDALAAYGRYFGMAFQIVDDVLDYTADAALLGKAVGDDWGEGKVTLPIIYALQRADSHQQAFLEKALTQCGDVAAFNDTLSLLHETGSIESALMDAKKYAQQAQTALLKLEASAARENLNHLVQESLARCM